MSRDHDNLLRGQGLFRQAISGFATRWKFYLWTTIGVAALGGIGVPVNTVEPWQLKCAYQHRQGSFMNWIASGRTNPTITVSSGGQTGQVPASVLANDPVWTRCWDDLMSKFILGSVIGGLLGFGLCFGLAVWMRDRGRKAALDKIIAGTEIVTERELRRLTKRATGDASIAKASNLLQFLWRDPGENGSFAFRDFIGGLDDHKGPRPWIFVPRKEDYFEAMKPLLACWLECAASATLGLEPSSSRRLWFFLDELADLPRVDNLTRLLPEGRKFGASVVLTFQAIGQMHRRYGRDSAEALLGCCNTKLYLQLIDRDTRKWASDNIGDVEVEIRSGSDSFDYGPSSGRTSLAAVRHVRAAVIESDMRLEPHHGFLQLPDALPVAKIKLTRAHIETRGNPSQRSFVPVDVSRSLWSKLPAKGAAAEATIKGGGPV